MPRGTAGSKGFATDDGSASFKCCCSSAADVSLNASAAPVQQPMDPATCNCDWATGGACNGKGDGSICYKHCCANAKSTSTGTGAPGCKAFCANHKRDDGTNSTWAERCAWKEDTCSSCSQCSSDSVKTEMTAAAPADKGPEGCENFCAKHKNADGTSSTWAQRCAWKEGKCSSCEQCKSDEVLTAIADEDKKKKGAASGCNTWCATHKRNDGTDSTWAERCAWKDKACSGCAECSSATTSAAA